MYSSKKVLLQKNNGSESSRIFTKVGMELHWQSADTTSASN
jgi:hypothetical protein